MYWDPEESAPASEADISLDAAPGLDGITTEFTTSSLFWGSTPRLDSPDVDDTVTCVTWDRHVLPLALAIAADSGSLDTAAVARGTITAIRRACTGRAAPKGASLQYREALQSLADTGETDLAALLDTHAARLLQVTFKGSARRGVTAEETADHRRRAGTYITPIWLARSAVDVALSIWLRNQGFHRDVIGEVNAVTPHGLSRPDKRRLVRLVRELELADICCGTAVFLRTAAQRLFEIRCTLEVPKSVEARAALFRDIVTRQIYGVERDPVMIDAAKAAFEELMVEGRRLGVAPTIVRGDALTGAVREGDAASEAFADSVVWYQKFPEVFARRGFSLVVSNCPWERPKVMGREALRAMAPAVAASAHADLRRRLLESQDSKAKELLDLKRRAADLYKDRLRNSGLFKDSVNGDFNLYGLFVERADALLRKHGAACLVVPTGIATDKEISPLFRRFMDSRRLACMLDFENRKKIFPEVDGRFRFCLFGTSADAVTHPLQVSFYLHTEQDLHAPGKTVPIRHADIERIKPATKTLPVCRSAAHLKLLSQLHEVGIPLGLPSEKGSWGIRYMRHFDMTTDSDLFKQPSLRLVENHVRLYEGRMVGLFDHRQASAAAATGNAFRSGKGVYTSDAEHAKKSFCVSSRYFVPREEAEARLGEWKEPWLLGYKEISSATNARTMIASVLPRVGVGNKVPLLLPAVNAKLAACLLANLNSIAYDFACRQHIGNITLNWHVVQQTPVLSTRFLESTMVGTERLVNWVADRVWRLTATAQDMRGWSQALGKGGKLHGWDAEERLGLMAELDALFLRLYQVENEHHPLVFSLFPRLIADGYYTSVERALDSLPAITRVS